MSIDAQPALDPTVAEPGHAPLPDAFPISAPVDVHAAIEDVRRMKEFQPPQPGWLDEWLKHPAIRELTEAVGSFLEQAIRAVSRFLGQLKPPGLAGLPENIRDVFGLFIGFVLVLMLLYALYLLLGWLLRLREGRLADAPKPPRVFEETLLVDSGYHTGQAKVLAAEGRYDEAVRQLYLAALCLLDESGRVPFEATRTNREYLDALAALRTQAADPYRGFQSLAGRFEASRYGGQPVDAEGYDDCRSDFERLGMRADG